MNKKLHTPHPLYSTPENGKPFVPLCGAFAVVEMAEKLEDVTCKRCLRRLESMAKRAIRKDMKG